MKVTKVLFCYLLVAWGVLISGSVFASEAINGQAVLVEYIGGDCAKEQFTESVQLACLNNQLYIMMFAFVLLAMMMLIVLIRIDTGGHVDKILNIIGRALINMGSKE